MLYLIGLGLNEKGISKEGLEAIGKCKKIYLENYTVDFPYSKQQVEEIIGKKLLDADREKVEGLSLVDEAKNQNIALLIYGSPLMATTHITLIQEAKKKNVEIRIIHNASIFDAIAETGLQPYKFGKTTSLPKHQADSFLDIVLENQTRDAHTLILVDIGLEFEEALKRVDDFDEIIVCSRLGTKDAEIYYDKIENFGNKKVKKPFCLIIPGKLHFIEEEVLNSFRVKD